MCMCWMVEGTMAGPFHQDMEGTVLDLNNPDMNLLRQHNISLTDLISRKQAMQANKNRTNNQQQQQQQPPQHQVATGPYFMNHGGGGGGGGGDSSRQAGASDSMNTPPQTTAVNITSPEEFALNQETQKQ